MLSRMPALLLVAISLGARAEASGPQPPASDPDIPRFAASRTDIVKRLDAGRRACRPEE